MFIALLIIMRLPAIFSKSKDSYSIKDTNKSRWDYFYEEGIQRSQFTTIPPEQSQLSLYNELINKKNLTTEEVLFTGSMLQKKFHTREETPHYTYTPSNHSGNWKHSLFYHLLLTTSSMVRHNVPSRPDHDSVDADKTSLTGTRKKTSFPTTADETAISPLFSKPLAHQRFRRAGGDEEPGMSSHGEKRPGDAADGAPPAKVMPPDKSHPLPGAQDLPAQLAPPQGKGFHFTAFLIPQWPEEDKRLLAPVEMSIASLKADLINPRKEVKQPRLTDVENKLLALFQQVSSVQAKIDIYTMLSELPQSIKLFKRTDLVLQPLPYPPLRRTFRFTPFDTIKWRASDAEILTRVFPDVSEKLDLLRQKIYENQDIPQSLLTEIETKSLMLHQQVTSGGAKRDIYALLSDVHQSITQTQRTGLVLQPLPPLPPHSDLFTTLAINDWPESDIQILESDFPDFNNKVSSLKKSIYRNAKILQSRFTEIETLLLVLFKELGSSQAKSDIQNLLYELQQNVHLTGKNQLLLQPLPAPVSVIEAELPVPPPAQALAPEFHYSVIRTNEWSDIDRKILNEAFPDFKSKIRSLKQSISDHQPITQQHFTDIENKLLTLFEQLTSTRAKTEIHTLLRELHQHALQLEYMLVLQQLPLLPVIPQAVPLPGAHFTLVRTDKWLQSDIDILKKNFPAFDNELDVLKQRICHGENISAEWFTHIESRLISIFQDVTSSKSKMDIYTLLYEIQQSIRQGGRTNLNLHEMPSFPVNPQPVIKKTVIPKPVIPLQPPPSVNFPSLKTGRWPKEDSQIMTEHFPDLKDKITSLKKSLQRLQDVSQGRFTQIETQLLLLFHQPVSHMTKIEIYNYLRVLQENIQKTNKTPLRFQALPALPEAPLPETDTAPRPWLMSNFRERNVNMDISWSAHDRQVQQTVAPGLQYELRKLAEKNAPTPADILRVDTMLTRMLAQFTGDCARATVQSIREAMLQHFREVFVPVPGQIHLLSGAAPTYAATLPLHSLISGGSTLTLWTDTRYQSDSALKSILSKVVRLRFLDDKLGSLLSLDFFSSGQETLGLEHIPLLQAYRHLMAQHPVPQEALKPVLEQIKQAPALRTYIRSVEASLPLQTQKVLMEKESEWGTLVGTGEREAFKRFVDQCESESLSRLARHYLQHFSAFREEIASLPERVTCRDLGAAFGDTSLYRQLLHDHYIFEDRFTVAHFLLASAGQQGLFTRTLNPVLSAELTALAEQQLGAETVREPELNSALVQALDTHLARPQDTLTFLNQPALAHLPPASLEMLALLVRQLPPERWFRQPEWAVPVLGAGVRFSTDGQRLTDNAIMAGAHPLQSGTENFIFYLDLLYYLHKRALQGRLTAARVQQKLHSVGLAGRHTPEQIAAFVHQMVRKPYQSLTAIHCLLADDPASSLAGAALRWAGDRYPLLKHLIASGPQGQTLAPALLLVESVQAPPRPAAGGDGELPEQAGPSWRTGSAGVVEQTKYHLLSWDDFYHRYVSLWDTAVRQHQGTDTHYHPQSLLTEQRGRCLGLSLLCLETGGDAGKYRILQENLMTASALYQTKYRDSLPLSSHDDAFLRKVELLTASAQRNGNHKLSAASLTTLTLSGADAVIPALVRQKIPALLVTTESHSMALQQAGGGWRFTDPNFGHTHFVSLAQALTFICDIVDRPALRALYGSGRARVHFSPDPRAWQAVMLPAGQTAGLTRIPHRTTAGLLASQPETVTVGKIQVPKALLHEIGATVNGVRIGAGTQIPAGGSALKLNGNILQYYLNTRVMTEARAQQIRALLETVGLQPGTRKVSPEQVFRTPAVELPFFVRLQQQKQHVKLMLLDVVQRLDMQLRKKGLSAGSAVERIDRFLFPDDTDTVQMRVTDKRGQHHTVEVNIPEISLTFREGLGSLAEGVDAMNLDAVMSVIGLVQYGRMTAEGEPLSALAHAGATMDVKNLLDKALGGILRLTGNRLYNPGISGARLEGLIAARLETLAARMGGTAGRYLTGVARVMKLPLLDTGMNIWALSESSLAYTGATHYSDRLVAMVDIVFSSITTMLSLASVAYPPLAIVIVPVSLFAQETRNFVRHTGQVQERRGLWLEAEGFLGNGAKNVLNAQPEEGILDLSNNQVLGDVFLDLRSTPPRLSGRPSFNSGKGYGSHPELTDRQVMEARAYNWVCTNAGDAHVPHLGGGRYRDTCHTVPVSTGQMALGYANRRWPETLPEIPPGRYHTVLLGYGETLQASTEVVRMTDGNFRELAREYGGDEEPQPLLSAVSQHSRVTGGDTPLTVVVPVADNMLLGTHLHLIERYKHYRFTLQGGKGGIMVQVGGIGRYDITGHPGARNVLSYHQMPRDFTLALDLSSETAQHIRFRHPSGFFDGTVMTLRQTGINTVIGTAHGYDRITGSREDNTFYLGAGGGSVHSGGGHNTYVIPGDLHGRCHIHLAADSQSHRLHFGGNSTRLEEVTVHRRESREVILLGLPDDGERAILVEGYGGARPDDFTDRLTLLTGDGLELRRSGEPATFQIARVNVPTWEKQHTGPGPQEPEAILAALPSRFSIMDPCTLEQPGYRVIRTPEMLSWLLSAPGQVVRLPQYYAASVVGSAGSRYILSGSGFYPVTLLLQDDAQSPEEIDISALFTRPSFSGVWFDFSGDLCRITAKTGNSTQVITLRQGAQAGHSLHSSQAKVVLSADTTRTLASLLRMASGGAVRLHALEPR